MLFPDETTKSASEGTPQNERRPSTLVIVLLIIAGVAILEIPTYLVWNRARRAEQEVMRLNQQAEGLRRNVAQARAQADAALARASQAEESAAQTAQQRDQAVQARTQSEQVAAQAQHEATVAAQQATQAQQEAAKLRADREAELDRLQNVLGEIASTRKTAIGLVVTMGSDSIRFDFDKATLRTGNRETLSRIAGVLLTLKGYGIYVYGYTDDVGPEQYNQKLSERRAEAVRDYLVQAGIDPNILSTKGYGKSDPLEKGDSAQARAKNRRVEIGIVDSVLRMQGAIPPSSPANQK
jgi:outer membrane protein OmpA-like peptidoglycan-associated protein